MSDSARRMPGFDERQQLYLDTYNARTEDDIRLAYRRWASTYEMHIVDRGWMVPGLRRPSGRSSARKGGSEILDVGAGTGLVGVALRELGFSRVYAFDLSPEMLEHALEKAVYRQIHLGNAERMEGIASDAFDAVICVGSLNVGHISPAAFTQFIRVTRPGGLIAFTTREDYYRDAARPAREALVAAGRWLLVEEREVENAVKDMPHRHFCYRCA